MLTVLHHDKNIVWLDFGSESGHIHGFIDLESYKWIARKITELVLDGKVIVRPNYAAVGFVVMK